MDNILYVSLQKRLNYARNFQKPQIKEQSILKRLEMHNSIAKNHRKILVVPLKESFKSMKLENFSEKKRTPQTFTKMTTFNH